MQKKNYLNAEIEILYFDKKDVITASGVTDPTEGKDESPILPEGGRSFFAQ